MAQEEKESQEEQQSTNTPLDQIRKLQRDNQELTQMVSELYAISKADSLIIEGLQGESSKWKGLAYTEGIRADKLSDQVKELVKLLENIELTLINSDGIEEIWFNQNIKPTFIKHQQ